MQASYARKLRPRPRLLGELAEREGQLAYMLGHYVAICFAVSESLNPVPSELITPWTTGSLWDLGYNLVWGVGASEVYQNYTFCPSYTLDLEAVRLPYRGARDVGGP